ncbi:MAG: DNA mismatch repair protein MutS, partial [Bacteroidales bacterium]|nr:DNA mismatch repair protein MutS [Bacteroidales bacterium]
TQPSLNDLGQKFHPLEQLQAELDRTLAPDPPAMVNKGGVIAEGISEELDQLRRISRHGKAYLQEIQQRESERTGIPSLKVAYNNVFGYYIEVRNTYKDRVPAEWVRKQTLVGAERYITQELKEYEEKILGAEDRILALESQLFSHLVQTTAQHISDLQENATLLAILDALHSLATIAKERHYVRPVVDESLTLDIRQGRHPVIETLLPPGEAYIPNDVLLNSDAQQIIIITGPNMAGKSALLRQTALIVLLAQMGGFVPATSARIGVIDKVFTRVGASDNLSQGESTFMVEMSEAANIMNNLTPRSLVLFDELGRGTSTYDGISIAWSIVERLHEDPESRARTLFATHYHELNEMEKAFPRVKNYNVSVREVKGKVVFLRTLQRGGSEHSFGIHVARLAGMPQPILKRAEAVLQHLEAGRTSVAAANAADTLSTELAHTASPAVTSPAVASLTPSANDGLQLSFFQLDDPVLAQIRDEIFALQIDTLTPIEALNKLHDIQRIVRGH